MKPILTREQAREAGLRRFYTNVRCARGHLSERQTSNGQCLVCLAENTRSYRERKGEELLQKRRERHSANRERILAIERERKARQIEQVRARDRAYWPKRREADLRRKRERYAEEPLFAFKANVRERIGAAFRSASMKKTGSTCALLGCTWEELRIHIERQFVKGMNWGNRGFAWHIDHIVPLASANTTEEVAALCHFTNLRPLWATENLIKQAKREYLI